MCRASSPSIRSRRGPRPSTRSSNGSGSTPRCASARPARWPMRGGVVGNDEPEWKGDLVRLLTDTFEARLTTPWSVDDAPADWVGTMLRGIVGIEMVDLQIVGKRKLTKNRSDEDRQRVHDSL